MLESKAQIFALIYQLQMLIVWTITCFAVALVTYLDPTINVLLMSEIMIASCTVISMISGISISHFFNKKYQLVLTRQISEVFSKDRSIPQS